VFDGTGDEYLQDLYDAIVDGIERGADDRRVHVVESKTCRAQSIHLLVKRALCPSSIIGS